MALNGPVEVMVVVLTAVAVTVVGALIAVAATVSVFALEADEILL